MRGTELCAGGQRFLLRRAADRVAPQRSEWAQNERLPPTMGSRSNLGRTENEAAIMLDSYYY